MLKNHNYKLQVMEMGLNKYVVRLFHRYFKILLVIKREEKGVKKLYVYFSERNIFNGVLKSKKTKIA